MNNQKKYSGAKIIVDTLIENGVKYVFGIPGAKIDAVFNEISENPKLELVVTYHEQNAAFMAQAVGRLTGKPGVCLVTSGPGTSNLVTGLVTANTEADPVVAIGGNVNRSEMHKHTHQSMDNANLLRRVTKFSQEVVDVDNLSEILQKAFRTATIGSHGASFVSVPMDITVDRTDNEIVKQKREPELGIISPRGIADIVECINNAKLPVILLGMRASDLKVTEEIRKFISKVNIPVVQTFQASGILTRDLIHLFHGRIGLFKNQPGDKLLSKSDLVISIGYDPIEYEPDKWNINKDRKIISIDSVECDLDNYYSPEYEYICDVAKSLQMLNHYADKINKVNLETDFLKELRKEMETSIDEYNFTSDTLVHPIQFIKKLQSMVKDEMTVCVDIGSHYIWMARYFRSYRPRSLLFSNGMQTLGVALPFAIATSLLNPKEKVISISGDGGFTFSAAELKNAVKYKCNLVHFVWNSKSYDMVAFQEVMKYGHSSGVDLEDLDYVKFAESFGAVGLKVESPEQLDEIMEKAFSYTDVPVVVEIPIDYKDNLDLAKKIDSKDLV